MKPHEKLIMTCGPFVAWIFLVLLVHQTNLVENTTKIIRIEPEQTVIRKHLKIEDVPSGITLYQKDTGATEWTQILEIEKEKDVYGVSYYTTFIIGQIGMSNEELYYDRFIVESTHK